MLDKLNEIANARFAELKAKQGIRESLIKPVREEDKPALESTPTPNENKFYEMYVNSASKKQEEAIKESMSDKAEDVIFRKIDALNLPPELSLAVSFIIIGHINSDNKSIRKAIEVLEDRI